MPTDGLVWLLALLLLLVFLQRRLHFELVAVFLLLTRRVNVALTFFSILFFPGVFLHEMSHWIVAKVLGVRTGRVSLIPERMPDGSLRMGYVEAALSDPLRDSLIGLAPLLFGGAFVVYAGFYRLNLQWVWGGFMSADGGTLVASFAKVYALPDFWLWFYLMFAVSSTMLPSASDRQGWLHMGLFAIFIVFMALGAGAGPWMRESLAPFINEMLRVVAVVFGISCATHFVLLLPTWMSRRVLNRLIGLQIV